MEVEKEETAEMGSFLCNPKIVDVGKKPQHEVECLLNKWQNDGVNHLAYNLSA